MVNIEELKQKIHEEEMKVISVKVAEQTKKNREKRIAREKMLSGPTEYIDLLRKAKVPINVTDIKQAVNPTKSKILEGMKWQERLVNTHAKGHVHGLYLRVAVYSLLFSVLMWL
jgi:hypothetical protein